jgi:dipeptide/tripeptide permease
MTEAAAVTPALRGSRAQAKFLGHPLSLAFLLTTEMWERFSYYGMRALLVLYMVKYVLLPATAGQVVGLAALKSFFESFLGPLDVQPFASTIYGAYTGLFYLTPIFGGLLADRVLGHRRAVVIGALLTAPRDLVVRPAAARSAAAMTVPLFRAAGCCRLRAGHGV